MEYQEIYKPSDGLITPHCEFVRSEDGREHISGYAIVWHNPADEGSEYYRRSYGYYERIKKGALDEFLQSGENVYALYDHNEHDVLGCTDDRSLYLRCDNIGLRFDIPYDANDPVHQKAKVKIQKNTIKGCSWSGGGPKIPLQKEGSKYFKLVDKIDKLYEISIVHKPCYKSTVAMVRSEDAINRQEIEQYEATQKIRAKLHKYIALKD